MSLAPILLFTYNRPDHTQKTLDALSKNQLIEQSILYIYSDGLKKNADKKDIDNISKVHEIISNISFCKEVICIKREENFGLAANIIEGITTVINKHGKVITLEDDVITSPFYLTYMNDALDIYVEKKEVISIGSYNYYSIDDQTPETFFLPIPDTAGWSTWKDRWDLFEKDGSILLQKLKDKKLIRKFNLEGAFYFERMLLKQIKGLNSSWAIRWQAIAYLENKVCLYPKYSVIQNIGFDEIGTHTKESASSNYTNILVATKRINVVDQEVRIIPDIYIKLRKVLKGIRKSKLPNWIEYIYYKLFL